MAESDQLPRLGIKEHATTVGTPDINDITQQSREEMEVLFTFLAGRYQRRSVAITSNVVFSEWSHLFKDPPTTAAAIDRVVHHATLVEFGPDMTSYRPNRPIVASAAQPTPSPQP